MSRSRKIFETVITAVDRTGAPVAIFCGILIALTMLAIVYEVVVRYVFRAPTVWSNEISTYLVVAATFLGLAYALLMDAHVRVDMFFIRFSKSGQTKLNIFASVMALIYAVVITWKGWQYAWLMYQTNEVSGTLLRIPLFPLVMLIPLGTFLLCLQFLSKIYRYINTLATGSGS
ncbi:MAG: TRAP transporter small permease subunit [Chloroflexi bacterium]|nr:TRAP transporter small permease subunit [Chloroflexota bacterium]